MIEFYMTFVADQFFRQVSAHETMAFNGAVVPVYHLRVPAEHMWQFYKVTVPNGLGQTSFLNTKPKNVISTPLEECTQASVVQQTI